MITYQFNQLYGIETRCCCRCCLYVSRMFTHKLIRSHNCDMQPRQNEWQEENGDREREKTKRNRKLTKRNTWWHRTANHTNQRHIHIYSDIYFVIHAVYTNLHPIQSTSISPHCAAYVCGLSRPSIFIINIIVKIVCVTQILSITQTLNKIMTKSSKFELL